MTNRVNGVISRTTPGRTDSEVEHHDPPDGGADLRIGGLYGELLEGRLDHVGGGRLGREGGRGDQQPPDHD